MSIILIYSILNNIISYKYSTISSYSRKRKSFQDLTPCQKLRRAQELTNVDLQFNAPPNINPVFVAPPQPEIYDYLYDVNEDNNNNSDDNVNDPVDFFIDDVFDLDVNRPPVQVTLRKNLTEELGNEFNFRESLQTWAVQQNIPHLSLDQLLKLLQRVGHTVLP